MALGDRSKGDDFRKSSHFIGVAVYHINGDGTLDATCTTSLSPAERGLGTEHLSGGTPGVLAGTYSLETFDDGGRLMLQGTTTISARGPAYAMTWAGSDGSSYEGVSLLQGTDVLPPATGHPETQVRSSSDTGVRSSGAFCTPT